jgi:hypothetical protein
MSGRASRCCDGGWALKAPELRHRWQRAAEQLRAPVENAGYRPLTADPDPQLRLRLGGLLAFELTHAWEIAPTRSAQASKPNNGPRQVKGCAGGGTALSIHGTLVPAPLLLRLVICVWKQFGFTNLICRCQSGLLMFVSSRKAAPHAEWHTNHGHSSLILSGWAE